MKTEYLSAEEEVADFQTRLTELRTKLYYYLETKEDRNNIKELVDEVFPNAHQCEFPKGQVLTAHVEVMGKLSSFEVLFYFNDTSKNTPQVFYDIRKVA